MHSRNMGWLAVLLLLTAAGAAAAAPPATTDLPLATDHLIYGGTTLQLQVDVNGEAAVQLIGGMLDAAADVAHQQSAALAKGGPVPPEIAASAAPLIEPAKEAIKSITRATLLVLRPVESFDNEEAMSHYQKLMVSRGWTPMVTVRGDDGGRILFLLAPGGKGVFGAVIPGRGDMLVGVITTARPLGDLLAEIVRAGGSPAVQLFLKEAGSQGAAPAPAAETCEEPAPEAPAEQ